MNDDTHVRPERHEGLLHEAIGAMKLPRNQNLVFIELWHHLPADDRVRVFRYRFIANSAEQFVVSGSLVDDPSIIASSTLGAATSHVFLLVSDGDPRLTSDILARIEDYDACEAHLSVGDTIGVDSPSSQSIGAAGFLITQPRLLKLLEQFPSMIQVDGESHHCLLCVPLTRREYALKKARGVDALLQDFVASGRDLVRLETLRECDSSE